MEGGRDPLNGPAARLVAAAIIVVIAASFVWGNRDWLFRPEIATDDLPPAVAACVDTRLQSIDDQVARGRIDSEMAATVRQSVVEFCRQTAG